MQSLNFMIPPRTSRRAVQKQFLSTFQRASIHFWWLQWTCLLFCLSASSVFAQEYAKSLGAKGDEYTFVRIHHFSQDSWSRSWQYDYPAADTNFLKAVVRLTHVHIHQDPIILTFDDDRIFEYPFLYLVDMGNNGGPVFSAKAERNLREYLLRGGFLFIDDSKGDHAWQAFRQVFQRIFPENSWVQLDLNHPIFHIFYDIHGLVRIPNIRDLDLDYPPDYAVPSNWAILDQDGRIMILINWNSDMGDAWQHTYDEEYPTHYANFAYKLGINFLIYAMTH